MSAQAGVTEFDLCGPLPRGVTLIEASAGTGKTFAIAALVARHVAEGVPLSQLLVVTFTRMATGELRQRVRDRLVTAELGLARVVAGASLPEDDRVLQLLAEGSAAEVETRRRRLGEAVAGFDAATIATTHGFCQQVLAGLGVIGDVERDVTFVEDLSDLVDEVVDDLYVRRFLREVKRPFDRALALRIGRAAVDNPLALLEPLSRGPEDEGEEWAMRRRLAQAVRAEVDERKRRIGVMTYDDLLTRLRSTLADEEHGAAAGAKLRERYSVALVDEFQDTDPIQWEIMRRAFGEGGATLVLIGDPKQAVYSFRGADVYAYLNAAAGAVAQSTLATNWRSDQGLIDALDALFDGAQLGHEGIVHRRVRAAEMNREPRLLDAPVGSPLRVRILHRADRVRPSDGQGIRVEAGRGGVDRRRPGRRRGPAPLVVRAVLVVRPKDGAEPSREPVRPRHIAVLVPTNKLAALVDQALERVGVPAVINGAGSVFASSAADDWLRLLEAVERPVFDAPRPVCRPDRVPRLERGARWLRPTSRAWEELHAQAARWAGLLRAHGVAALLDSISATEAVPRRVLATPGRRAPTDRPGSRRAAASHRCDRAATRRLLADGVAAAADRRRRQRHRQRGSRAAARLRRRGGAGADHPSQQGPRVPDRLPPVRVAARVHRQGRSPGLPRRPERRRLDDRRRRQARPGHSPRTDGFTTTSSGARICGFSTSRSPARCTRRPCGGRAVTRVTTRRSGACSSRATPTASLPRKGPDTRRRRGRRTARGARRQAAGGIAVETGRGAGGITLAGRAPHARRARGEHVRATLDSPGDASRTAASSPARGSCRWRREPEVDVVDDELIPTAAVADTAPSIDAEEQRLRATPALLGVDARRRRRRRPRSTACWRRPTSQAPISRPSSTRAWRSSGAAATSSSVTRRPRSPGSPQRSRRRSGRSWADLRLRDVRRPTGSTSSASSSRWSAVTRRRAPSRRATSPRCSRRTCPPATRWRGYADRLRDPVLRWDLRGYLTGTLDLVLRTRERGRLEPLRARRLQEQLARRRRGGAERVALPTGCARGGDAARPLPAPGPALPRRSAPLPARAAPRLRRRSGTSPAFSTCSSAG